MSCSYAVDNKPEFKKKKKKKKKVRQRLGEVGAMCRSFTIGQ